MKHIISLAILREAGMLTKVWQKGAADRKAALLAKQRKVEAMIRKKQGM